MMKQKNFKQVGGKHKYYLYDTFDCLMGTLNLQEGDSYPDIQKTV